MMKQGGFGRGALVWVRGAVLLTAASLAGHVGMAQSVRLVPSTDRFAGSPQTGTAGDFGQATSLLLNAPTYVGTDRLGNTYISDSGDNCIRQVDNSTGNMSVLVGQPTGGGGDTCQNPSSVTAVYTTGVLRPSGIAVDAVGNVFIADTGHNCVRRLGAGGKGIAALLPLVDTCANASAASIAPAPAGLALDLAGNLYIAINDNADGIFQVIRSSPSDGYASACLVSGSGAAPAKVSALCPGISPVPSVALNAPQGLTLDPIGNLYVADSGNACVREVTSNGHQAVAVGKCTNDGNGSASTALQTPVGVAADAAGHLFVNDNAAGMVYELISGQLTPVAGNGQIGSYTSGQDGQAAVTVPLNNPQGIVANSNGDLYMADTGNNIVRLLAQGLRFPETMVGSSSTLQVLQFRIFAAVNLTVSVGGDFQILSDNCSGAKPTPLPTQVETCEISLRLRPTLPGLRSSALTLTDSSASPATIYRFGVSGIGQSAEAIFIPGTINTLAKSLASPSAVAIDSNGDAYYAESGSGSGNGSVSVLTAGSTTPTLLVAPGAGVATPTALALDPAGNLYIADSTANAVLRYDTNGNLNTLVSGLDNPVALVVDPLGDIYVAEDGATTVGVLEIYAGGQQSVIAGQGTNTAPDGVLATTAKLIQPSALYLDANGVLYVADRAAYRVYDIDTGGTIHFFAGNGTTTDTLPGFRQGTALAGVTGLGADPAGDLYITDAATNQLFVAFSSTAQNPSISLLAGDGTPGAIGDGGPAYKAELNNPTAVAVDGAANVYIADNGNSSLREITYKDPTLNFGVVKPGQTGGPLSTTLWNVGNDVLQPLATIVLKDTIDFAIDVPGSGCGNSISGGSTCNLSFYFTPQTPGNYETTATLTDSSVNQNQVITLIGITPQTTLTSADVTVVYGDAYSLNATVTGNLTPGPTGSVTFSIGGVTLCGAQPLPANGIVTCMPSPTLEDVGVYSVTISYSGDTTYPALTRTITLTVLPRPVTITADNKTRAVNTANPPLTGIVLNVVPGQSILDTYSTTATISSPAGAYPIVPAYTFGPGTNPADYTVIVVNGTLTITSSGSGGGGGGGGTGGGGGGTGGGGGGGGGTGGGSTGSFTLAMTPPEQEIDHSGTVNYVVTLAPTGGFTGPVTLACFGLPEGASCAFAPASVTLAAASGTSTMTITATADTTNVPTVFSLLRNAPLGSTGGGSAPLLAWTMLPLGLGGSAGSLLWGVGGRRRRRLMLLVPFALLLAAGVTGCAGPSNYKVYTVTITGTATSGSATITQSSTIDLTLAR